MNVFAVVVGGPDAPVPDDAAALRWHPGDPAATIGVRTDFFDGWRPSRPAADLLVLAAGVYAADRFALRRDAHDAWTRELTVRLPVADPDAFPDAGFAKALAFLTGDRWDLQARPGGDPLSALGTLQPSLLPLVEADAVCLFSGGLDSLCGAVDLLESHPRLRLALVGHHDGHVATKRQTELHARLAAHYGADRVVLRRLWLKPFPLDPNASALAAHAETETTTRSRSVLFLAAALCLASALGPDTPVHVPENGFVSLNVPLTRARVGSASTRTTHPHFLTLFGQAARAVGVTNPLVSPYLQLTKGEMLAASPNPTLLRELAPRTVSCSHPEAARMQELPQGNCGYCFPCLVRLAAMHAVGWTDEPPAWDVLTDPGLLLQRDEQRGADLRAVLNAVLTKRPDSDLLRNAPLPRGTHHAHLRTWRAGTDELRTWLRAGAQGPLAAVLDQAT